MAVWNPWRGCHRYSEGCRYCYIHKGDAKRGVNTGLVVQTAQFHRPVDRKKNGQYRMEPDQLVYLCFTSDFLLPEADPWRPACWQMIRKRTDLRFLFLTKRIERFADCIPPDWGDGYDNVIVGCTVENQARAAERLPIFNRLPIRHRNIICQPMLTPMDLRDWLEGVELVVAGGESDRFARPLDYQWVLDLRAQCVQANVAFQFRQCGTHFIKDGKTYTLPVRQLCAQARKAGIDFMPVGEPWAAARERVSLM